MKARMMKGQRFRLFDRVVEIMGPVKGEPHLIEIKLPNEMSSQCKQHMCRECGETFSNAPYYVPKADLEPME